jgi:hypothetical protein
MNEERRKKKENKKEKKKDGKKERRGAALTNIQKIKEQKPTKHFQIKKPKLIK